MLTVGDILRKEREKKNLNLSQIEKKTKIREQFLKAIEENNWQVFSSKIYIEGIIRNYARFLGLDATSALAFFRRDYERQEEVTFKKRVASKHLVPETRKYALLGLIAIFVLFAVYFGYQITLYVSPPKVELLAPKEHTFKKQDTVKIVGKTEKEAVILIFNERVYQSKNGLFTYDFPLRPGRNLLIIEVTGANGKKTVIKRELFLNP